MNSLLLLTMLGEMQAYTVALLQERMTSCSKGFGGQSGAVVERWEMGEFEGVRSQPSQRSDGEQSVATERSRGFGWQATCSRRSSTR